MQCYCLRERHVSPLTSLTSGDTHTRPGIRKQKLGRVHGQSVPSAVSSVVHRDCVQWKVVELQPIQIANNTPLASIMDAHITDNQVHSAYLPSFTQNTLGFCKLPEPGVPRKIHLGYLAGKPANTSIHRVYDHPHYGMVGVNSTTHAKARFGQDAVYLANYSYYVKNCHCFVDIVEPSAYGWKRLFDDFILWIGFYYRMEKDVDAREWIARVGQRQNVFAFVGRASLPRSRVNTAYNPTNLRAAEGSRIIKLKVPRPSETLIFDRHLDHRKMNFLDAAERWKRGKPDIAWMTAAKARKQIQKNYRSSSRSTIRPDYDWSQPRHSIPDYVKNKGKPIFSLTGIALIFRVMR